MDLPLPSPSARVAALQELLDAARRAGADHAEAAALESVSLSAKCRMGKSEGLERSESRDVGLRVFIGKKQAGVSASGASVNADELAGRAVAMARATPDDLYCGLPERGDAQAQKEQDALNLCDDAAPTIEDLRERALRAENAGREIKGVTNSEGAEASWDASQSVRIATNGFEGHRIGTRHSLFAMLLAEKGGAMQRDYDYDFTRHAEDLRSPEHIGEEAATRAVRRLGAKDLASDTMPVLFEERVARSLLSHFAAAISGEAVARGTSFLKDSLESQLFAEKITIMDDPSLERGAASRAFDAEGTRTRPLALIKDGVLTSWFLDTPSARQLSMESTGHAQALPGSPPRPASSNLFLQKGEKSPRELMRDMGEGILITELIGMGVNPITGDYSRGAAGFRIEGGEIAEPVHEFTIAANLKDMFRSLIPADDLTIRYGTSAPSLLIPALTVAGGAP